MARQAMQVRELTGRDIGAEISGISLEAVDDEEIGLVRRMLWRHSVLVFRDQRLGPVAQKSFTGALGELVYHDGKLEGHPEMLLIANMRKERMPDIDGEVHKVTEVWHTDYSFWDEPPRFLVLAAQELPKAGGDTLFASQHSAYEALSDGLKATLSELRASHREPRHIRHDGVSATHPAVVTNPDTGRQALYVNPQAVQSFEGWTRQESQGLLTYLFAHMIRPDFVYRHRWEDGDVVVWDNRVTMHYAVDDYADAPRRLHRTSTVGDRPR
jgi:taurine dioxygenase